MILLDEIISILEIIAPPQLAELGDPIGLQIGNKEAEIRKIYVAVDPSLSVIEKSAKDNIDMLVTHHPLIYKPLKNLADNNPILGRVKTLIKSDICFYAMHTNLDIANGGINDALAERLELTDTIPLLKTSTETLYKVAVYLPTNAIDIVMNAMVEAGAGHIGNYSNCSFRTEGTGTFLPLDGTHPYIGAAGKLEEVNEYKLEMICPKQSLNNVIKALILAHPYEEAAYDIYELSNKPISYGIGKIGNIKDEMSLADFAQKVKTTLGLEYARVRGDMDKKIKRVAVSGGACGSLLNEAAEADVFVTGDIKHSEMIDAESIGLCMIDAGHFETERPGVIELSRILAEKLKGKNVEVDYVE